MCLPLPRHLRRKKTPTSDVHGSADCNRFGRPVIYRCNRYAPTCRCAQSIAIHAISPSRQSDGQFSCVLEPIHLLRAAEPQQLTALREELFPTPEGTCLAELASDNRNCSKGRQSAYLYKVLGCQFDSHTTVSAQLNDIHDRT